MANYFQFVYYKKQGFKKNFSELHYCDEAMLKKIRDIKGTYNKNSKGDFYKNIADSFNKDGSYVKGSFLKNVSLNPEFDEIICEPTVTNYVYIKKILRGLDPETMCFKNFEVLYCFEGIVGRTVYVNDGAFLRKFTIFDMIGALTIYVNDKKVSYQTSDCPFIKEVENIDGSKTIYPYAGYNDYSVYNGKFDPKINSIEPDYDRLEDLLVDLHLENFNSLILT